MDNFLLDPIKDSHNFQALLDILKKKGSKVLSYGNIKENLGYLNYILNQSLDKQILFISYEESRAMDIYEDLLNLGLEKAYFFPKRDLIFYNIEAHSKEEENKRTSILQALNRGEKAVVTSSVDTLFDKIISKDIFDELSLNLVQGDVVDLDQLLNLLIEAGYERVSMVEGVGQFSIRGGIIDIFPSSSKNPIRIELFDDELDSIRSFSIKNQRSLENLDKVEIHPVSEVLILDRYRQEVIKNLKEDLEDSLSKDELSEEIRENLNMKFSNILDDLRDGVYISNRDILKTYINDKYFNSFVDFFNEDAIIIIDEPRRVEERINYYFEDFENHYKDMLIFSEVLSRHKNTIFSIDDIEIKLQPRTCIENSSLLSGKGRIKADKIIGFNLKSGQSYHKKIDLLIEDLNHYRAENYRIIISAGTEERAKRLESTLNRAEIDASYVENRERKLVPGETFIIRGSLSGGFEYTEEKFVFINDKDIFGAGKKTRKRKKKDSKDIVSFTDLKTGDYVVHENHGIGRYEGVEQLNIQGIKKDYLNIRYRDGDKLFVPIDQMNLIQKYIGADSVKPKVNKLSSAEWAKTKHKARLAVEEMADELLELYAKREQLEGYAFSKDGAMQREFEDYFPHEETEGQLRSTEEIKASMESNKPMDRLLCGDVGYGKTEVALRAAFKAVADGKQVAFLVPTTILAQQHYNTIVKRFENFPINISMLSRFRSKEKQKADIKKLKSGNIDIMVGTHRLLSQDVKFKDLGLLIIDEEQRFGVKHKEKLKQLKQTIDVLTLTATPIPRTLHMSLSGIRDMSVIEEPPEERYPVQTYVLEYSDQMVRDAILKEVRRGGQVYFVYNKVKTIDKIAAELKKLLPEVSFAVAHGQMGERALENVMMDFYNKEYDVLVCTTIIETGLDIPNVNTIIIHDADKMGLSQLYQLRGRVGRADRMAYAYFTYEEDKVLSEVAERRLLAIKEFTEFGSGFKIAMRDLEIRGAGNLLGAQQHGQIEAIGYDLYVKFLNDTIKRISGQEIEDEIDTIIDLEKDGYIKESYIKDEKQKVEIYKRIASIDTNDEYMELLDELIDRFGDIPKATENLMDISYIRSLGSRNNIKSIIQSGDYVNIDFYSEDKIKMELIEFLSKNYSYRISFNVTKQPGFKYKIRKDVLLELKDLMEKIDSFNKELKV